MHTLTIERYRYAASLIHRLDPRVKLVVAVLFIVNNVLLPDGAWAAFALSWGLLLACNLLAGLGPGYTLRRSLVALPFALVALTVLFTVPGSPLVQVALGPWTITVSDAGLVRFASIVVRSWLSVQAAVLLTATTTFPDLMHALRHLRVPPIIIAVISFMYRYLAVLADEAQRLLRARESRSARSVGGRRSSVLWQAGVAGSMVGQLFLRSYERSERIYNAMLARGFRGQFLTLNPHVMRAGDWLAGIIALATLVLLQLVGRYLLGR